MAKPARSRHARNIESAANYTLQKADKAAVGFARWMTTDHSGFSKAMLEMPEMGIIDSIKYFIAQMIYGLISIVLTAAIAYVGIAYGIPLLFDILFSGQSSITTGSGWAQYDLSRALFFSL